MRPPQISKGLYWTPRIIGIIIVAFMALMSLDVFDTGLSFGQTMLALFMHNVPMLIMLTLLLIAWKYEIVGAIAFILGGIAYIVSAFMNPFEWYLVVWSVQIAGPAFVAGAFFWVGWQKRKRISITS